MEKKLIILICMAIFINWHWFEPVSKKNNDGITAYKEKLFNKALENFLSAKGIKPNSPALMNNTASALYNLKKYKEALEEFSKIDPEKKGNTGSDLFYNLGNVFFKLKKYEDALKNYKKSLILNPEDLNTKKNLELTLKKIKDQKKKKNNKNEDKKKKNENKKEKYKNVLNYLNQKEKDQMKKSKRKTEKSKKDKDW